MTENKVETNPQQPQAADSPHREALSVRIVRTLLVVAILAVGIGLAVRWMSNPSKTERKKGKQSVLLVEVSKVSTSNDRAIVSAMGTVIPARMVDMAFRVSGEISTISDELLPGGRFAEDTLVAQIDNEDYRLALTEAQSQLLKADAALQQSKASEIQRTSDVAKAEAALQIEMGQQSVAKREYELLGKDIPTEDRALVLREPQLKSARADRTAAQAALDSAKGATAGAEATRSANQAAVSKAELNLKRTRLLAPFNGIVQSERVDTGSQVAAGAAIAALVGTDEYWVRISVPVDELRWLKIPSPSSEEGSTVQVYHESAWGLGASRSGKIVRLLPDLETQGRMAQLLVEVKDPLQLKSADEGSRRPLLLGSYVRVEMDGREITQTIRVPRVALRDGDRVWVMKSDNTLEIRKVEIIRRNNDHVLISSGLSEGDHLILTDISTPVAGMALKTAEPARKPAPRKEGK